MITKRVSDIKSFIVMDILEKAQKMERQGIEIAHLEIGEPDFDTPECIKEAVVKAMHDGYTHYTHSLGILELREELCNHYDKTYKVSIDPDQIIITSGSSPAFFLIFSTIMEAFDQIIVSNPCYACYPNFIQFLQGVPSYVNVYEDDGFQFNIDSVKKNITNKTKAILINSPSNPTGTLLSEKCFKDLAGLEVPIISDEIYHGLVYEKKEHSILEYTDNAFVINGFSKLYAMTGLRLGYLIAPKKFIKPMQKLQQNFFISANSAIQMAGIAALTKASKDISEMKNIYNQRRKYMIQRLRDLGFRITVEPTGAFYILVCAKHISNDSYNLAFDILENAHVGVTPGIDFGENGQGYLRFSYANSIENIKIGLNRLERYLQTKCK